jgi:hypothetical protein
MLCREIMFLYSEIHTKHINSVRGQKADFLNAKRGGIQTNHWAVKRGGIQTNHWAVKR